MKVIRQGIRDLFTYRDIDIYRDLSWRERKALDLQAGWRALCSAAFWYLMLGMVGVSILLSIIAIQLGLASWHRPVIVLLCLVAVAPLAASARKDHVRHLIAERQSRHLRGDSNNTAQE